MNKRDTLGNMVTAALLVVSVSYADENIESKRTLKTNYQEVYNKTPGSAENLADMFKEGMFYGRLRSNTFYYDWEEETDTQNSHLISGLGGSLIYKSASFKGIDFTAGLYYSKAFFDEDDDPVNRLKPGKDVLSRYDFSNGGSKSMSVLGQAYVSYKGIQDTEFSLGRQLVETFYTKSNDTKMIPNTFDGAVIENKSLPQTSVKVAYLAKQKLRDHTSSHSVLMYDDSDTANYSTWNGNDDSAMHRGLTYTALTAAGKDTDAPLIVGDIKNRSIDDLSLDLSFYKVPELLSEIMAEANYKISLNSFSMTPGIRYIKQFDDGAGAVGGAAYDTDTTGYKDPNSLDAQMIAARVVTKYKNYKLNLGYTNILDEADLITPWRGFPTGGYTRSMARYNWRANTKSYRAKLMINQNKKGVYKDLYMQLSFLHTDADETKGDFDENYYYAGFVQNIPSFMDLQWRLRLGYTDTKKPDADSLDGRFELNYLF